MNNPQPPNLKDILFLCLISGITGYLVATATHAMKGL